MSRLRAGTGNSALADAAAAGREAATAALAGLGGEPPALVIVFASIRYEVEALLRAIRETVVEVPLIGCTSCGTFESGNLHGSDDPSVSVAVLTAGGYCFGVASQPEISADSFEKGRSLARAAKEAAKEAAGEATGDGTVRANSPHSALILMADGLGGADLQELLNGMYRVAGAAVPFVGGAAGDDRQLTRTLVFHDDMVRSDAAVALWVDSPHPLHVGCGHGWEPVSPPMMVTQSDGFRVERIGGRPAGEVFREYAEAAGAKEGFGRPGTWSAAHALGLIEPDGTQLIRGAVPEEDDSLRTFIPLPPYAAVQVVTGRAETLLDAVEPIIAQARPSGVDPGALIAFSCTARYDILGERIREETRRLQDAAGNAPTIGFFTYGEFARTVGVSGMHNATLTAIAL
ncbi:MAG: hypothetical protein QG622_3066 [Actinomycetota bacterium]|nr:hypothetical protein [Actinomycetota bacterium]